MTTPLSEVVWPPLSEVVWFYAPPPDFNDPSTVINNDCPLMYLNLVILFYINDRKENHWSNIVFTMHDIRWVITSWFFLIKYEPVWTTEIMTSVIRTAIEFITIFLVPVITISITCIRTWNYNKIFIFKGDRGDLFKMQFSKVNQSS